MDTINPCVITICIFCGICDFAIMEKFRAVWKQEPMYNYVLTSTEDNDELYDFPTRAVEDSNEVGINNSGYGSPHLKNAARSSSVKKTLPTGINEVTSFW